MPDERPHIPRIRVYPRPDGVDGFIVPCCPHCGAAHAHGVGSGHRLGHCAKDIPGRLVGYYLVPVEAIAKAGVR